METSTLLPELGAVLRSGGRLAAADLVANFTPGLVAGLLLGWEVPTALVLGGVTYISSSGIAAKLIEDLGWLANAETPHVLSLLVAGAPATDDVTPRTLPPASHAAT